MVLAIGMAPDPPLYEACLREYFAPEAHNIGDRFARATIVEAMRAGHAINNLLLGRGTGREKGD